MRRGLAAGALAALAVLWACLSPPINLSTSRSDGGSDGSSGSTDGNSALIGQFTIDGCADLSFPAGEVRCVGTAPLRVTLVLIQLGATTYRWKLVAQGGPVDGGASGDAGAVGDGGAGDVSLLDDAASRSPSPSVILKTPGTYQVTLGVAGPGGTATAAGTILVRPAPLGAACTQDGQCEAAHPKCVEGRCVECTTTPDSCPFGQYCVGPALRDAGADARDADADAGQVGPSADPGPDVVLNVCAPGCSSDTACSMISTAAPFCHPKRHQCVQCLKPSDCSNVNEACSPAGRCATKCSDVSFVCPIAGQKCCAPFCVDITSDIANCNGCGNACTGGATTCCNAQCKNPLTANDTCGVCGTACSGATCKAGTCR